ncbi:hypothetical protein NQ317_018739 [Molorchus minor]|uniref:Uncharacterized protein n=1 Tax=Molorchus minor TaxID=1323400 RepID=A0ABQ9JHK1_9CUCU|nr:hypothetical protein NQ317_018739 [Molorchus minor]
MSLLEQKLYRLSGAETLGRIPIQSVHCVYVCVSKKDASPLQRAPQVQNGRRSRPPHLKCWYRTPLPLLVIMCEPRINIDEPRYDQETYFGRAAHFFQITNPLNLFVSNKTLEDAKCIVTRYRPNWTYPFSPPFTHTLQPMKLGFMYGYQNWQLPLSTLVVASISLRNALLLNRKTQGANDEKKA